MQQTDRTEAGCTIKLNLRYNRAYRNERTSPATAASERVAVEMSSSGTNLERGCIRGQQYYLFTGKLGSKGNMVVGKKSRPAAREAHTSASKSHSTVVSRWWLLVV